MASVAGSRPSSAIGLYLDQLMLPGEPVVAALRGTIRMMPAWVVVTPAILVVLRDGKAVTLDAAAGLAEGVRWQAEESWGDTKLHLSLGDVSLTVSQVNARRLAVFINDLEFQFDSLDNGFPSALGPAMDAVDAAITAAIKAAPLKDPDELQTMLSEDISQVLAGSLNRFEDLTFELALLVFLTSLRRSDMRDLGRRGIVAAAITGSYDLTVDNLHLVGALFAARTEAEATLWRGAVGALESVVSSALTLLAPGSPDARSLLHAVSVTLRAECAAPNEMTRQVAASQATDAPVSDVLDRLERLQKLRESGALTEDEYDTLKKQALRG